MVDKGEGDQRYQELKDGIYHGYQPLRARKTITYSYTPDFIPGALNMFVLNGIALNNIEFIQRRCPGHRFNPIGPKRCGRLSNGNGTQSQPGANGKIEQFWENLIK